MAGAGGGCSGCSLSGCGGDDRDALTIYTGRTESLVGPLLERFSEENDIAIDVRYGDTNDLALLIGTEGDRCPADVYWGQSPGATAYLAEKDLLAPLPQDVRDLVAPGVRGPDGRWVGTSGRQRVLVYNEDAVDGGRPAGLGLRPDRRPRTAGKVGLAPTNGSFQDFITAMRGLEGEDGRREVAGGHGGQRRPDLRQQQRDRRGRRPRRDPHRPGQPLLQPPLPGGGPGPRRAATTSSRTATSAPS